MRNDIELGDRALLSRSVRGVCALILMIVVSVGYGAPMTCPWAKRAPSDQRAGDTSSKYIVLDYYDDGRKDVAFYGLLLNGKVEVLTLNSATLEEAQKLKATYRTAVYQVPAGEPDTKRWLYVWSMPERLEMLDQWVKFAPNRVTMPRKTPLPVAKNSPRSARSEGKWRGTVGIVGRPRGFAFEPVKLVIPTKEIALIACVVTFDQP